MIIRKAEITDLKELLEIYNYEVKNGVATLDLEPRTLEQREEWFYKHNIHNHPLFVAEIDNCVAGYASLSSYREKEAYKSTVELSIYIGADYRKKGVASKLMEFTLDEAKKDERTHTVVSVITAGNEASRKLHEKFGFEFCGTIKEVGMKFGEYRDIENYRLGV
ncbi:MULTISPECIES: GNAT family N-acetyltransferase [Clostridium]|uniref:Phosphinothricin acetyltransferase n=1 Tax=Clostridium intestinale DSM 6191 TaxID=1121320 RepID=A0A1M6CWP9_9CLOT|nr:MULTISPECIES: GNAT family N-acetyltransferase [Clostridium]SHI65313.1 phosphinothricin acetyltransferase [Clostridium intestinale DSM 6191]